MRSWLLVFAALIASVVRAEAPPNVIIILTDDQGYNDVGCFGSTLIKTPRLDRMASEGTRFTDWYAPAPVCTPTRAGLMTGCYPQRLGLSWILDEKPDGSPGHVLYGRSRHGLNLNEITIAELLKGRGYATGMIGKWHLGDAPQFLPTRQGFDSYFGVPYSNDMKPPVLMREEKVVEEPYAQETVLERYAEEATKFIREHAAGEKPFFLYFAHNAPHTPLFISSRFKGKSARGLYGDMIEAIDWSVGQVLDALVEAKIDDRTLVIYSSDNGPWHLRGEDGGSAFPLRGGKGTTYEGGMRVPCIMRWPRHVPAGRTCGEPLSHLDIMPTVVALAGGAPPNDRVIDGKDIGPILRGEDDAKNPHEAFFYYGDGNLNAVRSGKWKYKLATTLHDETEYVKYDAPETKIPPALYDLENDIGEQKNVAADHPEVVARMKGLAENARVDMGDRRTNVMGKNTRPIGQLDEVRVMSFNIRVASADDGENSWPNRRELLFGTIETFMPDVLGLQEVQPTSQKEVAARLKGYELVTACDEPRHNPSPLMVRKNRFTVEKSGLFWLSPTPEEWESKGWDGMFPRVVTWAQLRDRTREGDAGRVFYVNTHWDHRGEEARLQSATLMRQRVAQIAGDAPLIITGDFNCPDDSPPYAAFTGEGPPPRLIDSYRTIHPQHTADDFTFHHFTGKAVNDKCSRIDWILHDPAFRTMACEIVRTNENGHYPSDHFPLTAVLERAK